VSDESHVVPELLPQRFRGGEVNGVQCRHRREKRRSDSIPDEVIHGDERNSLEELIQRRKQNEKGIFFEVTGFSASDEAPPAFGT
jgi:hypothetical protein